jgi:CRISPR/Cas system-associated endonuclease Cas1
MNNLLNYCYAVAEIECRLACLGVGLDLGLGVLHADQRARDSMALDLLEPVRPEIDRFVLQLVSGTTFGKRSFFETERGVLRVGPHSLASWPRACRPGEHRRDLRPRR